MRSSWQLADERPVIFYNQLGAGNSDAPDGLSLWTNDRFVDELGRLLDALGLARVHLLGQSWGTTIAAEYDLTPTAWASSRSRPCSYAAATARPDPRTPPGSTAWCQAPSSSCSKTAATCPTSRNPSPTSRHYATSCAAPSELLGGRPHQGYPDRQG
jgi:proline iminopeptidase